MTLVTDVTVPTRIMKEYRKGLLTSSVSYKSVNLHGDSSNQRMVYPFADFHEGRGVSEWIYLRLIGMGGANLEFSA